MLDLFPHIEPYEYGLLEVDNIHKIYWEKSGNKKGSLGKDVKGVLSDIQKPITSFNEKKKAFDEKNSSLFKMYKNTKKSDK